MNTASAPTHHVSRLAIFATLLTLVFALAAWAMTALGHFNGSVTVAVLALSAFAASWTVTGHRRNGHNLHFTRIRAR